MYSCHMILKKPINILPATSFLCYMLMGNVVHPLSMESLPGKGMQQLLRMKSVLSVFLSIQGYEDGPEYQFHN